MFFTLIIIIKKTLLGSKVLMGAEVSLGPGKRECWKRVGSLGRGKLKGTDMWMAHRTEKEGQRHNQFRAIFIFIFLSIFY